jgi:hypothetical protein
LPGYRRIYAAYPPARPPAAAAAVEHEGIFL